MGLAAAGADLVRWAGRAPWLLPRGLRGAPEVDRRAVVRGSGGAVPVPAAFCLLAAVAITIKGTVPGAAGV